MFSGDDFEKILNNLGDIKKQFSSTKKDIEDISVEGSAGGGIVKVTLNGLYKATKISINKEDIADDFDLLEDLVMLAINDAVTKLETQKEKTIAETAKSLNISDLISKFKS